MNWKKSKTMLRNAALMTLLATLAVVSGCGGAKPAQPSVIVRDTIVVTETKTLVDTLEVMKDTTIYQEKVKLELKYLDRVVRVKAECAPDTIRITQVKVVTPPAVESAANRKKTTLSDVIWWAAFILVLVVAIRKLIDKILA
jgi:hypothetical protein